jgi:hypothetical protein
MLIENLSSEGLINKIGVEIFLHKSERYNLDYFAKNVGIYRVINSKI